MTTEKQNLEKILLVAIFTTFMGQIYMQPFGSGFRLTFAVVVLNVLMLTFKDINALITINLVGIMMFVVRSLLYVVNNNGGLLIAMDLYYPILFFYVFYSFFFHVLDVRSLVKTPLALFLAIWICDSLPNVIEVLVRQEWKGSDFESIIFTIILIGVFRTVITTILVYISRYYYHKTKERENHQIFVERILMISNLKTELFFLRKSKKDIEDTMRRSFLIYEQADNSTLKESILSVTKDIHEIKKDYARVISGLEKSIKESPVYSMGIKEIIEIIISSNKKYALSRDVQVKFHHNIGFDFRTTDHLAVISILNNLVTNAIEAFDGKGKVFIEQYVEENNVIFKIEDDGHGIEAQDIPLIFEAGFSTKFNENNGVMASGIGLTHVKYLVENYLEGSIQVQSLKNAHTHFKIAIPTHILFSQNDVSSDS
jgi:two-component system sensor histidine kinase YcbA